jgi:hypothetical protein
MTAFRRHWTVEFGGQVVAEERLGVDYAYLPDGMGRVGKKSAFSSRWEGGPNLPGRTVERTTETFVLNDFYNLLDEEITTIESLNGGPPTMDFTQKVYTMGPGLDFPLAMRHNDSSYLYYLNGHGDVSGFVSMDGSYVNRRTLLRGVEACTFTRDGRTGGRRGLGRGAGAPGKRSEA